MSSTLIDWSELSFLSLESTVPPKQYILFNNKPQAKFDTIRILIFDILKDW
jgi:hypothetical protein